jgi:hypothetical protein
MEEKFFLVQIKRANGVYEKGVVIKDSFNAAQQSFHAYLGAYGYGADKTVDYVACHIIGADGVRMEWKIDDRRNNE